MSIKLGVYKRNLTWARKLIKHLQKHPASHRKDIIKALDMPPDLWPKLSRQLADWSVIEHYSKGNWQGNKPGWYSTNNVPRELLMMENLKEASYKEALNAVRNRLHHVAEHPFNPRPKWYEALEVAYIDYHAIESLTIDQWAAKELGEAEPKDLPMDRVGMLVVLDE